MLPNRYIEQVLQRARPDFQEIALELRNIIVSVAPTAIETALWKGLSYYHAERGGPVSAGICQISVHEDHVRLGFVHGAFLPDPRSLLEGDRKAKRFLRITSYDSAPWDYIEELITASSKFDPSTLQAR